MSHYSHDVCTFDDEVTKHQVIWGYDDQCRWYFLVVTDLDDEQIIWSNLDSPKCPHHEWRALIMEVLDAEAFLGTPDKPLALRPTRIRDCAKLAAFIRGLLPKPPPAAFADGGAS